VCGAKLVDTENVTKVDDDCRLCQEIVVKQRRLQKEKDNITRWSREGRKFAASIEKAQGEARSLEETIRDMGSRRPSVVVQNNWVARRETVAAPITAPRIISASAVSSMSGHHGHHGHGHGASGGQGYGGYGNSGKCRTVVAAGLHGALCI
jgi:hypothetical protein